ncbi:uncharacterized protein LOC120110466 [Phoenix dactylifera]|uniref:Uncharacterized protein LOC120110466 n=1 Tax=Phoenix dactylifera TaxID=42345 RepID=A0A8B9A489_PHODC|nr:uncharacterized protein LOC120110466 [Phoenix dactylifera]
MLAKSVATECKTRFFNISASSINCQQMAWHHTPSAIFLDDIDAIMSQHGEARGEHEASPCLKTELLVQGHCTFLFPDRQRDEALIFHGSLLTVVQQCKVDKDMMQGRLHLLVDLFHHLRFLIIPVSITILHIFTPNVKLLTHLKSKSTFRFLLLFRHLPFYWARFCTFVCVEHHCRRDLNL